MALAERHVVSRRQLLLGLATGALGLTGATLLSCNSNSALETKLSDPSTFRSLNFPYELRVPKDWKAASNRGNGKIDLITNPESNGLISIRQEEIPSWASLDDFTKNSINSRPGSSIISEKDTSLMMSINSWPNDKLPGLLNLIGMWDGGKKEAEALRKLTQIKVAEKNTRLFGTIERDVNGDALTSTSVTFIINKNAYIATIAIPLQDPEMFVGNLEDFRKIISSFKPLK